MDVNPEDIETLSVLKGAAAAALYGSRAADGVVIITTKKGADGVVKVNVASKASTSWPTKLLDVQHEFENGISASNGVLTILRIARGDQKSHRQIRYITMSVISSDTVLCMITT